MARLTREYGYAEPLIDPSAIYGGTSQYTVALKDDVDSGGKRGRVLPFKVLGKKSVRLGAKDVANPLAKYEAEMTFFWKGTLKWKRDVSSGADTYGALHRTTKELRLVVLHNGMPVAFPACDNSRAAELNIDAAGAPTSVTPLSWNGTNGFDANKGNQVLCASRVTHIFDEK